VFLSPILQGAQHRPQIAAFFGENVLGKPYARSAAIAWNVFGMADLINAVAIGVLTGGGGGGIVFPIVLIPIYGVPRAFLIHSYSLIGLLRKTARQPKPKESLHYGTQLA
jgi:fatty acid desaturase